MRAQREEMKDHARRYGQMVKNQKATVLCSDKIRHHHHTILHPRRRTEGWMGGHRYRKAKMIAVPAALAQICRSYHTRTDGDVQKYVKLDQNSQCLLKIAALPHGTACPAGWWCHEAESCTSCMRSNVFQALGSHREWPGAMRREAKFCQDCRESLGPCR